jgi:hypothetical protein
MRTITIQLMTDGWFRVHIGGKPETDKYFTAETEAYAYAAQLQADQGGEEKANIVRAKDAV